MIIFFTVLEYFLLNLDFTTWQIVGLYVYFPEGVVTSIQRVW